VGHLPNTGRNPRSQATWSRLENARQLRDVIRLTYALVNAWMDRYAREPVTPDIIDVCDVNHGASSLSLFNAHDELCFPPVHLHDTDRSKPVAADIVRPARASFFRARGWPCRHDRANGLHCFCQRARSPCLST
jgi:hypothetical protein